MLPVQPSGQIEAEFYKKTDNRKAYRNGYGDRSMAMGESPFLGHRNGLLSIELFTRHQ